MNAWAGRRAGERAECAAPDPNLPRGAHLHHATVALEQANVARQHPVDTAVRKVPLTRLHLQVRIFNKLHNMRRILHATFAASAAMMNAFLLFVVIISIYAVMAVNLFSAHVDHPFTSFSRSFYTLLGMLAHPFVPASERACVRACLRTWAHACVRASTHT